MTRPNSPEPGFGMIHEHYGKEGGAYLDPNSPVPAVKLLSNGHYHAMVTAAGAGYSRCGETALTRWREDGTRDCWGAFIYVRDRDSGHVWAAGHQPIAHAKASYGADFSGPHAVLLADAGGLRTRTDVFVCARDDLEIRRVTITNNTESARTLDLTSYAEVVLAPAPADNAHPAFNKLFVQTEWVDSAQAILCHKRPGNGGPKAPWLFHAAVVHGAASDPSYETDRARFLGRGNTPASPRALSETSDRLSGGQGSVLDPIMSIRCPLQLGAGESITVSYLYGAADTRDDTLALIARYRTPDQIDAALADADAAYEKGLDGLGISAQQAQLFGRLAGAVLFNDRRFRADPATIIANRQGQSGMWGFSVSGDYPIILLELGATPDTALFSEVVKAYAYWRLMGLPADVLVINAPGIDPRTDLQKQLEGLVDELGQGERKDQRAGIFVRVAAQVASQDRTLFRAVARVVLTDEKGSLSEQLRRTVQADATHGGNHVGSHVDKHAHAWAALARKVAASAAQGDDTLVLDNGLGGFTADGKQYVIDLPAGRTTPTPWTNVLANPRFGTIVSESGCANTFSENAHEFRLTPWSNDPVGDSNGEAFYLRDEDTGEFWSPTPWPSRGAGTYTCRHGFGYSEFTHDQGGIQTTLTVYVARGDAIKFALLKVRNASGRHRLLSATGYVEWVLGDQRIKNMAHVCTSIQANPAAVVAHNAYSMEFGDRYAFFGVDSQGCTMTADRAEFMGRNGYPENPAAMHAAALSGAAGAALDPCAAVQVLFELGDGQEGEIAFKLGAGRDEAEVQALILRFQGLAAAHKALAEVKDYWNHTLGAVRIDTPDPALNMLGNGWLVYQTLACRLWARSAFYQPGGAFGFRDQLQDVMALVHTEPDLVRAHILLSASRQYPEGDVQHWWHPPGGRGVRTRCSDDYLWLALATCRYIAVTGDTSILDEQVHFLTGRPLDADEDSYYELPGVSDDTASLYDHCERAIRHGWRFGRHGLPLMGAGDWNDGMNKVGAQGRGESVWMAFFLYTVMARFKPLAQARGAADYVRESDKVAAGLTHSIGESSWDGDWFLRGYFDDGSKLGSAANAECKMGSIAQSWSVLSGAADASRAAQAMDALDKTLVDHDNAIIKLLAPPFDTSTPDPGYIRAYVPGVRENGGQYTHAAVWATMAFAQLRDHRRAWELLSMLNPANHAVDAASTQLYKVEPYVVASDVYALPPHTGRGGWTWYSGSAGWLYRLMIESILGLQRQANTLTMRPCIPADWDGFGLDYRFGTSLYRIRVTQAGGPGQQACAIMDGEKQAACSITLADDGKEHRVDITVPTEREGH
jgi:cellobiose phosphorylase